MLLLQIRPTLSEHFVSDIYTKGEKIFNIYYIQEMSNALVLYWLNEKYP